jgi:two-component sensor histidine kinase/ligand-binding sensor domain-containing protein
MTIGFFCNAQQAENNQNYIISKRMLSVEDGLPSRLVFDAAQDKDGFMWFATLNGLCRYDGHFFKIYNTQNSALSSNVINSIAIDDKNHLFIQSTQDFGTTNPLFNIQVLDLNTNQFISIHQALPGMPFVTDQANNLIHDASGNMYFLTDQRTKIWQYGKNKRFALRFDLKKLVNQKNPFVPITASIKAANGCVQILTYEAQQSYCIYPDTIIILDNNKLYPVAISEKKDFILEDVASKKYVVMDSFGKKVNFAYRAAERDINHSNFTLYSFDGHSQLFKSNDNNYFLQIENQWINIYNTDDQKKFPGFGIYSFIKDSEGNYWFCTEKGIYQVNYRTNKFEHIFSNYQNGLFINNAVRGICVDRNNAGQRRIYGMVNYGLMIKDKEEIKVPNITAAVMLKKNDWLYCAGNPLLAYNAATRQTKKIVGFINIGETWSMADFSDSLVLIGGTDGMIRYNTNSGNSVPISFIQKSIPAPMNAYRIIKTKEKGWVAVAENGIYFINNQCEVFDYFGKDQKQPDKKLPFAGIFDFYEDKEGIAWLATNGDGLIRWNWNVSHPMDSQWIKKFTIQNGLPNNILYRIEEDNANHLWISSYNGLVKFNKSNFTTKIYRTKDGLANAEFNRISSFKDADGWLYFGGQNGIDFFDPRLFNEDVKERLVPFRLVGLSKYSSSSDTIVDILNELNRQKEIVMNVGDRFLSVSFSLLDYQSRTHLYAYRIEGVDKDWNYVNEDAIRISGLPFGKFVLHVKAQLESGSWNAQEIVIPITVLKPFYLETWFFVSLFILMVLLFLMIYLYRVNKLKKDKSKLESLVQKRTHSLSEALEEREMLLKEIHHRVKNNLQVITGLLQLQKEELKDQQVVDAFNEGQSRVSSIALIHQNLYQNKDLGNIEFKSFLHDLYNQVAELYENETRKMKLVLDLDEIYIDIDTAVPLGLIVNELLTNSYKYAFLHQAKANVNISLIQYEKGKYKLAYHDNGPGLKEVPDFNQASTLGIKLIGGLAKQLSGRAEYFFEQGSIFIIYFKDTELRKMEK